MRRIISGKLLAIFAVLYCGCNLLAINEDASSDPLTFSVVGDIMSHDLQIESAYDKACDCWDYDPVFSHVAPILSESDLAIGNFETTLPGDKKKYSGYPQFGSPDALATAVRKAGFDIVTTANNHSMDKGKSGVRRTLEVLDREGLLHLGTYATQNDYQRHRLLIVERKGIRLALLNYTYGTNGIAVPSDVVVNLIDKKTIAEEIALARSRKPDAIIVLYHFGGEYLRYPDRYQLEMVDHAFHEGADIVLGGHPHVLQPFEIKQIEDRYGVTKERLVIYSLGNFVSNQQKRYTDGGIIFRFALRKTEAGLRIENVNYIPVWVYVERLAHKVQFHILPVEDFLSNGSVPELTEFALKRMVRFHEDTTAHLRPSIEKVQLVSSSSPDPE